MHETRSYKSKSWIFDFFERDFGRERVEDVVISMQAKVCDNKECIEWRCELLLGAPWGIVYMFSVMP